MRNLIPVLMIATALAWFVYLYFGDEHTVSQQADITDLTVYDQALPMPTIQFTDAKHRLHNLTDFRGKFILLNIWATWCVPCRDEMPSLDRLQAKFSDSAFQVVALSTDQDSINVVSRFYQTYKIRHLAIYHDNTTQVEKTLNVTGLPSTFLIDKQGRLIASKVGYAVWDSEKFIRFIGERLKE